MATRDILYAAAGASGPATYVEDVFSTWLYTGTGSPQTITNSIDLSTKGGLVWIKSRSNSSNHLLFNTVQGATKLLRSNTTDSTITDANSLTAFNTNGFSLGVGDGGGNNINTNTATYASWTFAKQLKFFDIVTYTGDGVAGRTVAHNLGSVPGMIIVKNTSGVGAWEVYHRGLNSNVDPQNYTIGLQSTAAQTLTSTRWNNTAPTSTEFTVGTSSNVNDSGATYVAYLFAHNAGGFGVSGSDNVISCGFFTTDGSGVGQTVDLGYEPQFILYKSRGSVADWRIADIMRGMTVDGKNDANLRPNSSGAETSSNDVEITSTGFFVRGVANGNYIYTAIRRGPMKTPTSGTEVFSPIRETNSSNPQTLTTGFPVDLTINTLTNGQPIVVMDRLRGGSTTSYTYLDTTTSGAENAGGGAGIGFDNNTAIVDSNWWINPLSIFWNFRRAPGFFDIVCYTATGSGSLALNHNLGATPQMMIVKGRSGASDWPVYHIGENGGVNPEQYYLRLNATSAQSNAVANWGNTTPTTTQFTVAGNNNASGYTYVAYLFATLAGVSKVGSYTGTGSTLDINAGLPTGARFVMIKRTDSTGDWWVWDTARGMVAGTDPRIPLNSAVAQSNNNWVYTQTDGFQIVTTDATVNASGGSYIYLAIA